LLLKRLLTAAFLAVLLALPPVLPAFANEDPAETAANACLAGILELYDQGRMGEAADKYLCAADVLAKAPGHEERAARYSANAWFYRSWATFTEKPVAGPLGRENLEDAIRQVEKSLPLWKEAHSPQGAVGERMSQAWLLYLTGVRLGFDRQFPASREAFDQAREMFVRIGEDVPPLRGLTEKLLSLAEDETVFAEIMNATNNPGNFVTQGGYVQERLDDMKRREQPERRPYYDSLGYFYRSQRQFLEAGDRLEAWDYQDADAVLDQAGKALEAARPGAGAIANPTTAATYQALLSGWSDIIEAEKRHAAALKALLANGETAKAREAFLQGVADYRRGQENFEKAGLGSGSMDAIEKTYARLRERSDAVAKAFGAPQALLILGKAFFGFFAVTLGTLTALRPRLNLKPPQIVWTSLAVALISAFSLRSIEFFQVLGSMPK
jgi:hypothetical protein